MLREVYADLLFLINFSMDFLSLYLCARFMHKPMRPLCMCCSAVIGGIYSVISIFIPWNNISFLIFDVLICFLMCTIVFYSKSSSLKQLVNSILMFIFISAILGGIMTALFNQLNRINFPLKKGGDNISSWLFLLLAAISGLTAFRGGRIFQKATTRKMVNADITFDGASISLCGITDTGNILHDPTSGKPVIITDIISTLPLLPDIIKESILSGNIDLISNIPPQYMRKIRIIPCNSISGSKIIIGIVPDKIILHTEKQKKDVSAIFAPVNIPGGFPKGCNAIIPGELNN